MFVWYLQQEKEIYPNCPLGEFSDIVLIWHTCGSRMGDQYALFVKCFYCFFGMRTDLAFPVFSSVLFCHLAFFCHCAVSLSLFRPWCRLLLVFMLSCLHTVLLPFCVPCHVLKEGQVPKLPSLGTLITCSGASQSTLVYTIWICLFPS